jgi:hypothetical protein
MRGTTMPQGEEDSEFVVSMYLQDSRLERMGERGVENRKAVGGGRHKDNLCHFTSFPGAVPN